MKFRFWGYPLDAPPENAIRGLCKLNAVTTYRMSERLKIYEKFSFIELQKTHAIEKIKGRNPDKVHELRMGLPDGKFRLFFIIIIEEDAMILHIAAKKKQKIKNDIELAMKRAAAINNH